MTTTDNETEKNKLNWGGFVISAICIVIATFGYWAVVSKYVEGLPSRGQFGDMFGGLTSLFTGLAFAGLIYTILIQRKELQYQREEITLQRIEMTRFADAQEKSEEALSKQAKNLEMSIGINTINYILTNQNDISRWIRNNNKHELAPEFGQIINGGSEILIKLGAKVVQEGIKDAESTL